MTSSFKCLPVNKFLVNYRIMRNEKIQILTALMLETLPRASILVLVITVCQEAPLVITVSSSQNPPFLRLWHRGGLMRRLEAGRFAEAHVATVLDVQLESVTHRQPAASGSICLGLLVASVS